MNTILLSIAECIERGKADVGTPFPPEMKGLPGAYELVGDALASGLPAKLVLEQGLIEGMRRIGQRFKENKAFVPEVLMAAKAMNRAMLHLKPLFESNSLKAKGNIILGTVAGDLHDIGKNIVSMIIRGNGWNVIDLGVNVNAEKFVQAALEHKAAAVGLSALLTTTMLNMEAVVKLLHEKVPGVKVIIGGAPLSDEFARQIHADLYSADPQGAVDYLDQLTQ